MLVYLDFLRKRQMEPIKRKKRSDEWFIRNNGEIVYPYKEAAKKGIGRREFRNAIDELIAKGFLDITHQGSGGRAGDMTKYFLDDRWKDYGKPAFRPAKKPRQKDCRQGRGWSAYHGKKEKTSVTKSTPGKQDSSNKSDTPNRKIKSVCSNKDATPIMRKIEVTNGKKREKSTVCQLNLWSNTFDTIL